jgi:hypothetical protein
MMHPLNVLLLLAASVAAAGARAQSPDPFFEANGRRPGVVTLQDGLQYRVLAQGAGPPAADAQRVALNYTGTLLNGTVFGSNRRGEGPAVPRSFAVADLVPGLREAVRLMRVGSRWEVYIPTRLGFARGHRYPQQRSLKRVDGYSRTASCRPDKPLSRPWTVPLNFAARRPRARPVTVAADMALPRDWSWSPRSPVRLCSHQGSSHP